MSRSTIWALLTIAPLFLLSRAQSCLPGYEWANNQRQQDVCQIMQEAPFIAHFDAPRGDAAFSPPSSKNENMEVCSGVYWLLVSSCADCLGRPYNSWSTWSGNCRKPFTDQPPDRFLSLLPRWLVDHLHEFITMNVYDPDTARGSPRPPSPPPPGTGTGQTQTPPAQETPSPDSNTVVEDSTTSSPDAATSTSPNTDELPSTRPPFGSESLSAASAPRTSIPSETDSRSLRSTTILTTITSTDSNGQQTVFTSAMPTLVDPSGSGFGDSPDAGTTLARSNKPNVGAIVGGVVAGLVVIALVVAVLLVLHRRRRKARIAPSTAFIKEYNREFERYEDGSARTASPRPFNPAGGRSITPSNSLPFVADSKSQDQLLETSHGREQDHYRSDSVKGHAVTASLLDGRHPRT